MRESLGLFRAYLEVTVIMKKERKLQLLEGVERKENQLLEAIIAKESLKSMMKKPLNAVKPLKELF